MEAELIASTDMHLARRTRISLKTEHANADHAEKSITIGGMKLRDYEDKMRKARQAFQRRVADFKKKNKISSNKYNASILHDGKGKHKGSMLELSVLALYRLQERAGEISELRHQVQTHLTKASVGWRLDFSFMRDGVQWYGEAKGLETEGYLIKRKLWTVYGLGPLEIWHGDARRPFISQTIFPKTP